MAYKFVMTGERKGKTFVLNDRYGFVDGEMPVTDTEALNLKTILCDFNGCELVHTPDEVTEEVDQNKDTSLAKDVTKDATK